jgi:hypothetical protein
MHGLNNGVGRSREEAIDEVRAGNGFRLGATVAPEFGPDAIERRERSVIVERDQTTSFFSVFGFGSGAYSAKLLAGTRQRFSGLSQPRQCGDDVLWMLVTGGPPIRGGGGMPQRTFTSAGPSIGIAQHGAG